MFSKGIVVSLMVLILSGCSASSSSIQIENGSQTSLHDLHIYYYNGDEIAQALQKESLLPNGSLDLDVDSQESATVFRFVYYDGSGYRYNQVVVLPRALSAQEIQKLKVLAHENGIIFIGK
ncbi:MAG: hypothetical protein ACRDBX_00450 [Erysipelotrichaceae bacterium]